MCTNISPETKHTAKREIANTLPFSPGSFPSMNNPKEA
jgi:hypothetical protein